MRRSRGVSITTPLQYYFYGLLLTIDTLYREASIDAADFFNIRENILNILSYGRELWPSYRRTPCTLSMFLLREISRNSKKVNFPRNVEILFPGSSVTKNFSLTSLGCPRIMKAKIWPRPLRIWRKCGANFVQFFGGWSPSGGLGEILYGSLKNW